MTKLLFSVRITEKYFSNDQIKRLEEELSSFNSKSEFMRKIIKFYLKHNNSDLRLEEPPTIRDLKNILEENNSLLQQLSSGQMKIDSREAKATAVYQGDKQVNKTKQALSLLEQF